MRPLIQLLGYDTSENFLSAVEAAAFDALPFSHLCRKGLSELGLQGVYLLREDTTKAPVPVVAVCKVNSEQDARRVHKLVWNQDYVPFVLVESPTCVRLYSGFNYPDPGADGESGLITPLQDFNRISEVLDGFQASQIDDGTLWQKWGQYVDPSKRVDWRLLESLGKLAAKLKDLGLDKDVRHAFIGRYAYLRYLLDRGFLSDRKLARWGLEKDEIFSPNATLKAFRELNARLDDETDGLNGSIFPFSISAINKSHLHTVACAFAGHDPESGQQVFDFMAYDFSYIPIETLSVIYEQFLHEPADGPVSKGRGKSTTKGREEGAYYTPIPLVNFMIAEMDARKRLEPGMKVLDPSCGSGAFLVQTYRMLIERAIRASGKDTLPPGDLRQILTKQIYGVDRDTDACRIAEMSLLVTLLDYVNPPDLEGRYKGFLLPTLAGNNIFEADFFDSSGPWVKSSVCKEGKPAFDWVIGNPPWKEIKNPPKDKRDKLALDWMTAKGAPPTGGNQLAEAFVWKCQPLMREGAAASMVLPAMTLFKSESIRFRQRLFSTTEVWCIVNFANLAYVLFSGRTSVPAMSLFFQKIADDKATSQPVMTFAPMVLNQEANRPLKAGAQLDTWNLVMNASEIREIPQSEAARGDGLTWKVAMWGTFRDSKLLAKLKGFPTLQKFAETNGLKIAEGFQLRDDPVGITIKSNGGQIIVAQVRSGSPAETSEIRVGDRIIRINKHDPSELSVEEVTALLNGSEGGKLSVLRNTGGIELQLSGDKLEYHPELAGEWELLFARLKNCGRIINFDESVMTRVAASRCWVRKGRAVLPMAVSQPPHLVVDATRRFTVYRDDFVVIPSRKIGIGAPDSINARKLLRALALFLNSSLAQYFEFFHSSEWGVQESISTLKTLKLLTVPFKPDEKIVGELAALHERLTQELEPGQALSVKKARDIDQLIFKAANLLPSEQSLIEDFIGVQLLTIKGKVEKDAIRGSNEHEVSAYLTTLRDQLDDYMEDEDQPASHHITAVCDHQSAMIEIILREGKAVEPIVKKADETEVAELKKTRARLLKKHRQWIYFDRNLRLYNKGRLYLFKPLQRIQWTRRQAILDADELIAEALGSSGD
jgi:hypothetical protein